MTICRFWSKQCASAFATLGADYEIYDYLERSSSPYPTDPVFLNRVRFFVEDVRGDYLVELISDLTGTSGREWRVEEFKRRPPRKKGRGEWDEIEAEQQASDPGVVNLGWLINEFIGYLRRVEGVPFPRGQLAGNELYS
jgi:hypothetical protein